MNKFLSFLDSMKEANPLLVESVIEAYSLIEARERDLTFDPIDEILSKYNDKKYCVHFSKADKVGINPNTKWNTPHGVYGYPIIDNKDMLNSNRLKSDNAKFFATDYPNIFILETNYDINGIPDISNLDSLNAHLLATKMMQYVTKIDDSINDSVFIKEKYDAVVDGQTLWEFSYFLKDNLNIKANKITIWTKLWLAVDINWIGDTGGIIHKNEPLQRIHFSPNSYKVVNLYKNKKPNFSDYVNYDVNNIKLDEIKKSAYIDILSKFPKLSDRMSLYNLPIPKENSKQIDKIMQFVNTDIDIFKTIIRNNPLILMNASTNDKQIVEDIIESDMSFFSDIDQYLLGFSINDVTKFELDDIHIYYFLIGDYTNFVKHIDIEILSEFIGKYFFRQYNTLLRLCNLIFHNEEKAYDLLNQFIEWLKNSKFINVLYEPKLNKMMKVIYTNLVKNNELHGSYIDAYFMRQFIGIEPPFSIGDYNMEKSEMIPIINKWNDTNEIKLDIFTILDDNKLTIFVKNPNKLKELDISKPMIRRKFKEYFYEHY